VQYQGKPETTARSTLQPKESTFTALKANGSLPTRLLAELIAVPSVNPAFGGPQQHLGERAVGDVLVQFASQAGLSGRWQPVLPDRPNLLITLSPKSRARQRVLLAPHLDTVGLPGSWDRMFCPVQKSGRMYGRGACDTKGSLAAMLAAVIRVATSGPRPTRTEIVFAGLVDEENAQAGSRALVKSGFRANLAIVGEPTQFRVVTAHKGDIWLRLQTRGKAAHGARPELGRNAVHHMAQVVEALETDYAGQLRRHRHPLLGCATVNVGSIQGGTQPNIVPAECSITVDRRTLPGETERSVRREIRELLRERHLQATIASARSAECVPLETDASLPLVRALLQAAGQHAAVGVDFFCDAAVLARGRIPSVVFGPGDIAQAHTADEWVSLRSLELATDLLEGYLRSLP
jgi:acetylornithine deacetylase/succinyl-diaminopimelate desuccinylase-like protein